MVISERRRDAARRTRLRQPVVSVGNIAMGGRGKTPAVACIARLLVAAGERPAILSRGYGRRTVEDGAVIVSDGTHLRADVDRAGDEPLLLARAVPGAAVVVCDQRAVAGALAERVLAATVHILDDGFQHHALARDVDIVLVRAADLDDRRVPFGRLREPLSPLRRADAIVADENETGSRFTFYVKRLPVSFFHLARRIGDPVPLEPGRGAVDLEAGVVAVSGIAEPKRFVASLEARGIRVAYAIEYRDHHCFTVRDLDHIARAVRRWDAGGVLTTEKDAVRLLRLRPLPVPIAAVPLEATIEDADEFRGWLLGRLMEARQ
jgi:tetraacyldisaccharide 4'-kinase